VNLAFAGQLNLTLSKYTPQRSNFSQSDNLSHTPRIRKQLAEAHSKIAQLGQGDEETNSEGDRIPKKVYRRQTKWNKVCLTKVTGEQELEGSSVESFPSANISNQTTSTFGTSVQDLESTTGAGITDGATVISSEHPGNTPTKSVVEEMGGKEGLGGGIGGRL